MRKTVMTAAATTMPMLAGRGSADPAEQRADAVEDAADARGDQVRTGNTR